MGVDPWVDKCTFPLLFEMQGTPWVLPPTFSRVDIVCTNAHGIRWTVGEIFVKFSQLILLKIITIVAIRCQILR